MESIIQVLKMIVIVPLGILVALIMGTTDSPSSSRNAPMTEQERVDLQIFRAETYADCESVAQKGYDTDQCYFNVSMWNSDIKACDKIKEDKKAKQCVEEVSFSKDK